MVLSNSLSMHCTSCELILKLRIAGRVFILQCRGAQTGGGCEQGAEHEMSRRGDRDKGQVLAANQRACQEMGRLLMFSLLSWQENLETRKRGESWLQQ